MMRSCLSIVICALLHLSWSAQAAIINAATGSFLDVSNAVASASSGDTVMIPAGTNLWESLVGTEAGDTMLIVSNCISIIGAGTNATWIQQRLGHASGSVFKFQPSVNMLLRLSGITFTNMATNGLGYSIMLRGSDGVGNYYPIYNMRVDHCAFYNCGVYGGGGAIWNKGRVEGVIDHNYFEHCQYVVRNLGDQGAAWGRSLGAGTTNMVVFESNYNLMGTNATLGSQLYHEYGNRTTMRHNEFYHYGAAGDPAFFECHGNENYHSVSTNYAGTVLFEIYKNTFHADRDNYRFSVLRGGTILCYSNVFEDATGVTPPYQLNEEETYVATFVPNDTVWPWEDQITNSFFWANTINGSAVTNMWQYSGFTNAVGSNGFVELRDFFLHSPWTGTPYTNGSGAVNSMTNYAALTYPHPLVTDMDNGPVISSVVCTPTSASTATVTWTTDEAATSRIECSEDTSYTNSATSAVYVTSHSLGFTSLLAATTYNYRVISADAYGNSTTNTPSTFATWATNAPSVTIGNLQIGTMKPGP